LFLVSMQPYYAMMNATFVAGGWQFDSPTPSGSSFGASGRDCKASPKRFPCGAASAPDAQVSGTVQSPMIDPNTKTAARPAALFDGLAVQMVDEDAKALKSIWIVLSGTGVNPQMVAQSDDPDQVKGWLNYPVLAMEVAPDGKRAKIEYYDGSSRKDLNVTSGLNIDTSTPNRVRGSVKTSGNGVANIDVTFDIGTLSACAVDKDQCGG
jgi:hypothetical protein